MILHFMIILNYIIAIFVITVTKGDWILTPVPQDFRGTMTVYF